LSAVVVTESRSRLPSEIANSLMPSIYSFGARNPPRNKPSDQLSYGTQMSTLRSLYAPDLDLVAADSLFSPPKFALILA